MDGYSITNQVDAYNGDDWEPTTKFSIQPYEAVITNLRTGRLGNLSVAYLTVVADSEDAAHEVSSEYVASECVHALAVMIKTWFSSQSKNSGIFLDPCMLQPFCLAYVSWIYYLDT